MNIYNCCCLCLEKDKNNGDSLIWIDGMQLCKSCYKNYTESDYYAKIMPLNAIKRYRRMIADITEEYKNEQLVDLKNLNNYINKDKIREKIKSLEEKIHIVIPNEYNKVEIMNEFKNEGAVDILKELLEEE